MDSNKAKYNAILEKIIAKRVEINVIISYLHKNRLKFNDLSNIKSGNEVFNSESKSSKV